MHKLTSKRQVTIPQNVCEVIGLNPGDYVEIFERDGVIHVVKMSDDNLAGEYHKLMKDRSFPSAETIKESIKKQGAKGF